MDIRRACIYCLAAIVLLSVLTLSCGRAGNPGGQNNLTDAEKGGGWTLLFNGRNLRGWTGLGLPDIPKGHWLVEGEAIKNVPDRDVPRSKDGRPSPNFDLATVRTFWDFELAFEWKVASGANSGVKYNVSERMSADFADARHTAIGFEYQVLDDTLNPDAKVGPHRRAAALYDIFPGVGSVPRPVGEYNSGTILFRGRHGEHWLNGVKVLEYDLDSPEFVARLASSKFGGLPGFDDKRKGHIVLQDHGDAVWFRNIKLRELGPGRTD